MAVMECGVGRTTKALTLDQREIFPHMVPVQARSATIGQPPRRRGARSRDRVVLACVVFSHRRWRPWKQPAFDRDADFGGSSNSAAYGSSLKKSRPAVPANGPVVLGAKNFIVWGGIGVGIARPSKLVVGSDPSVIITRIRWHGWNRRSASGVGSCAVPRFGQGGDYYRKQFRADLAGLWHRQVLPQRPTHLRGVESQGRALAGPAPELVRGRRQSRTVQLPTRIGTAGRGPATSRPADQLSLSGTRSRIE